MKILAIDTSTSAMGIALLDEQKVYAEIITNLKKNHSVRLMPTIDHLFSEVNWSLQDIDLITCAKGPGSYTGVRIGVTTAKTFSYAIDVPLIGVSTLEAMAYGVHYYSGIIAPIIDARRGQAYTGVYASNDGLFREVEHDQIVLMEEWLGKLKSFEQDILFVGEDVQIHKENIKAALGDQAIFSSSILNIPRPSVIGQLGKLKYDRGEVDHTFDFKPAYLQLAEAEAKLLKNKG